MLKTRLSSKNQIVIPKEAREKTKLQSGNNLFVHVIDQDHIMLSKEPVDHVKALEGLGKEVWQALGGADKYIKEERASWDRKSLWTQHS